LQRNESNYIFYFNYIFLQITDADGNEVFVQQDMSTMSKRMALRLPVDEDDYLLPSPQHMGNSVAYMDLIGDGKGSGKFFSK
jgi:hypothetical protein